MKKSLLVVFVILAFAVLVSYVPVQAEQTSSDSKEWVPEANLPESRTSAMTASVNGKIYVLGGTYNGNSTSTTYVYDPKSNVWIQKKSMPQIVSSGSAVVVGEKIYVLGGSYWSNGTRVQLQTVLIYDTQNDTWEKGTDMPVKGSSFGSAAVIGNKIYVVWGNNEGPSSNYCYDTEQKSWSKKNDLPLSIHGATVQTVDNKIYLMGGSDQNLIPPKTTYDVIYEYNQSTDSWLEKQNLITGVAFAASTVLNGEVYIIGGATSNKEVSAKVQVYNPKDNTISECKEIKNARMAAGAATIGQDLYIIGGQSKYDPITNAKLGVLDSVEMFSTNAQTDGNTDTSDKPTSDQHSEGDRAILTITMTTGLEKEFDLSMEEVNDFINWYDQKDSGTGPSRYEIDKHNNNIGPFENRKDHVIFKNILTFEVNEYSTNTSNNQSAKTT
ncbi:Kelch repeat-containing protein [Bacillus sp. JNUCC-21]|uniref:Kelch repeat-containing protein n=1 Tax=Bacillus sp. JNUCC-21 TaxID=3240102 RepID=UPI003518FA61